MDAPGDATRLTRLHQSFVASAKTVAWRLCLLSQNASSTLFHCEYQSGEDHLSDHSAIEKRYMADLLLARSAREKLEVSLL